MQLKMIKFVLITNIVILLYNCYFFTQSLDDNLSVKLCAII